MASSKGPFEGAAGLLTDVKNCVYKITLFPYIVSHFTRLCRHIGFVTFSQNPLLTTFCTHPSQHQYFAPPLRRFPTAAIAPLHCSRNISPLPPHSLSIAVTLPLHCRHTPSPLPSQHPFAALFSKKWHRFFTFMHSSATFNHVF